MIGETSFRDTPVGELAKGKSRGICFANRSFCETREVVTGVVREHISSKSGRWRQSAARRCWPSSTEAAIPPNRPYLIVKKDLLALPSSASSRGQFPLSAGTGTFSRPLSGSSPSFRSFSSRIARAKRKKGNSGELRCPLLGLVTATVLLGQILAMGCSTRKPALWQGSPVCRRNGRYPCTWQEAGQRQSEVRADAGGSRLQALLGETPRVMRV